MNAYSTTATTSVYSVDTWISWNSASVSTTASTVAIGTWALWNEKLLSICTHSISSATTVNNTWIRWNVGHLMFNETQKGIVTAKALPETAAQKKSRETLERQWAAEEQRRVQEQQRYAAEIAAAKEKAEKLLQSALDPVQKEELKTKGFFHCRSVVGNLYRIYRGSHGNVKLVGTNGKEVEKLCVQPHYVPEGDCMLSQKLHIEHNEDEFRKTANITLLN